MLDYYEPHRPTAAPNLDGCDVATVRQLASAADLDGPTRQVHHAIRGALSEALAWFVATCEEADGTGWRY